MVYALFPCLPNRILENSALNHYILMRREQALRGSVASVCSLTWASSGLFCETGYPAFKHHHQTIGLMVLNPVCTFESLGCFFKTYGYRGHSPRPIWLNIFGVGPGCLFLYFLPVGMPHREGWSWADGSETLVHPSVYPPEGWWLGRVYAGGGRLG